MQLYVNVHATFRVDSHISCFLKFGNAAYTTASCYKYCISTTAPHFGFTTYTNYAFQHVRSTTTARIATWLDNWISSTVLCASNAASSCGSSFFNCATFCC